MTSRHMEKVKGHIDSICCKTESKEIRQAARLAVDKLTDSSLDDLDCPDVAFSFICRMMVDCKSPSRLSALERLAWNIAGQSPRVSLEIVEQ